MGEMAELLPVAEIPGLVEVVSLDSLLCPHVVKELRGGIGTTSSARISVSIIFTIWTI